MTMAATTPTAEPSAANPNGRKTTKGAKPRVHPSAAEQLAGGQRFRDSQKGCASGNPLGGDQGAPAIHSRCVAAEPLFRELLFCAEYLDDIERVRIATENRLRAMVEAGIDADDYVRQAVAFKRIEHEATLALQRVVRRHPLGDWIRQTKGVGEKQGARLLAAIGPISWRAEEIDRDTGEILAPARPRRGPAELWAYCGYAPGQKRTKGVKSNWNASAKMRAFLIATSCIKWDDSPYRAVYNQARASWADREVKDGHKHNHALRLVAKALLKDLFLAARAVA